MSLTMKEKILQAAERRVRGVGFAEMSFRDLARDVGIKSASVHYHFPTKPDLGEALVSRYADRFKAQLDKIDCGQLTGALDRFVALYAQALVLNESICLCAIMGAESIGLPEHVNARTKAFFEMNTRWLTDLLERHGVDEARHVSGLVVAALEGGMIVASTSRDRRIFDDVAATAKRLIVRD